MLYLDEIQYLNKKQQQSLLECIEDGSVTLIASTTENPYFYIYNALLSRCVVFEFKSLSSTDVQTGLQKAVERLQKESGNSFQFEEGSLEYLSQVCGGDMRKALGCLEFAVSAAPPNKNKRFISMEMMEQVAQRTAMRYDREGDDHYDILSGFQKAMRVSDPDAALHYLARLLEAGDLISACRRLLVCACEDVGVAWPQIIPIVKAAVDSAQMLGMPEARIPLANAVVLVSTAPKSNSAYLAINAAMEDVRQGKTGPIPRHLQNKHFDGEDALVKGQFYQYPHAFPNHWVEQQYFPDALVGKVYYEYGANKTEQAAKTYWNNIKTNSK